MARRKQNNAVPAKDATTAPTVEVSPASATATTEERGALSAPSEGAAAESTPAPSAPSLRRFRVGLPAVPEALVEASTPEEAYERYKVLRGITSSDHRPTVVEVE